MSKLFPPSFGYERAFNRENPLLLLIYGLYFLLNLQPIY